MKRSVTAAIALATHIALRLLIAGAFSAVIGGCATPPRLTSPANVAPAVHAAPSLTPTSVTEPREHRLHTPTPLVTVDAPSETTQRHLRVFEELWEIINEKYIYPDFNGFDWFAARIETEALIRSGLSDEEFYDLMRDLVEKLGDKHSRFLSPAEVAEEEAAYRGTGNFVGIGIVTDFNPEAGRVYVLQVLPGSPAEEAGIKPHDHLIKANGAPLVNAVGEPDLSPLRGEEGTAVTVTVRTPGQAERELVITRRLLSSAEVVEYRLLQGKPRIGYILIPTFFAENIVDQVHDAVRALMTSKGAGQHLDGLVIDMRINGGGAYSVLTRVLGLFTGGTPGYLVDRENNRSPVRIRPERVGNSQSVPLAVLIGPATESYGELFAGILRHRGRAVLIGQTTAGNVETLYAHAFEDGSRLWIAQETFQLANGASWEGRGIEPDIRIDKNWDEFTVDDDPAIQAAIEHLSR
ncbi:MAG: S41 family peptidase [Anaerolineae bacterium]|nr:S41 family peptidase [Thermoflexales bacterium]MDW8407341.1 S41 family peptidase [Anaerolineae bacterium]